MASKKTAAKTAPAAATKKAAPKKAAPAAAPKTDSKKVDNSFAESTFNHAITALRTGTNPRFADELYASASKGEFPARLAQKAADTLENTGGSGNGWLIEDLRKIK